MTRRFDVALSFAAISVYVCNRYISSFDAFLPYEFAHYHLGDLCGGVLFPAYFDLLTYSVMKTEVISSYRKGILPSILCSLVWEVITPILTPTSTSDPIDAAMYAFGTMAYVWCHKRSASTTQQDNASHVLEQGVHDENRRTK